MDRIAHLIRHGEYDHRTGRLTERGREQSRLTAQALAGLPVRAIHSSTLPRAEETAAIIAGAFDGLRVQAERDLCECLPAAPFSFVREFSGSSSHDEVLGLCADAALLTKAVAAFEQRQGAPPGAVAEGKAQAERAFARLLAVEAETMPAGEGQVYGRLSRAVDNAPHEIIVCHGNIIRYLVCRSLGVAPELWANMATYNCGITSLLPREDGPASLLCFNDGGHLPRELRLF